VRRHAGGRAAPVLFTAALLAVAILTLASCGLGAAAPRWDHIVIVIEENKDAAAVMGSAYFTHLAGLGTTLTHMYGLVHPSQPNYIGLFSGGLQGVLDNTQHDLSVPNLASSLASLGFTFASYAEGLPSVGSRVGESGRYVRRHNPAASFTNVPDGVLLPFSSFPTNLSLLPTVSFVIPNLDNDMHDGSVSAGDAWLAANMDGYVQWALGHNSLFIVTFDENDTTHPIDAAPIATIIVGDGVGVGTFDGVTNLYSILKLVLASCGLPSLGADADAAVITLPPG
jgi:phosphatidylinositol-3-phosphatase